MYVRDTTGNVSVMYSVKTMVMSGKAPVDVECPLQGKVHVYYEGSDIYDCMLNQVGAAYLGFYTWRAIINLFYYIKS